MREEGRDLRGMGNRVKKTDRKGKEKPEPTLKVSYS